LKKHDYLSFGAGQSDVVLRLESGNKSAQIALSVRMLVSDFDVLYSAAVAGLGIALLPAFRCVDDLRARRLERVLRDWSAPPTLMHVVYPSTRHVSPKVKSFVDHLHGQMTPPPWELGPMP
jgi:DNA-binding transcriptional LysR family regulator